MIILIGFMGVGKSTVGHCLAHMMGWSFFDLDAHIESQHGPISDIFSREGESVFRQYEYEALVSVTNKAEGVVATGGGVVTHSPSVSVLNACHHIVWLRASFDTITDRIANDSTPRPLAHQGLRDRWAQRTPMYESIATNCVDVDHQSPKQIAQTILTHYGYTIN